MTPTMPFMPRGSLRGALAALCAAIAIPATAGTTETFTYRAGNYPGSRDRVYQVYRPDGLSGPAPMVMALHGCQQTEADVLQDWGLTVAADSHGFILVTPRITSYDGLRNTNCWGFWFDAHRHEGRGEPEDLHGIAQEVESRFRIDPERRYITGLSSGAAMAVVAGVTHNEYWAAAASAAGIPYGEDSASVSLSGQCPGSATFHPVSRVASDMRAELDDPYPLPLMVLQSNRDCTVVQPAGRNLRDAHLQVFGSPGHTTTSSALASEGPCTPIADVDFACVRSVYTADGTSAARSVVETVFFDGPIATPNTSDTDHGHYWIGGDAGRDGRWSIRRGPVYPELIWSFFERHPRSIEVSSQPRISIIGPNPLRVPLNGSFTDPGATATDLEDGSLPVSADCGTVDVTTVGRYVCTYTATDGDANTATAVRSVEVVEPDHGTCAVVTASPRAHVATRRANVVGWFFSRAITTGDRRDIGFSWNGWSGVTLFEGDPGLWYVSPRPGCLR